MVGVRQLCLSGLKDPPLVLGHFHYVRFLSHLRFSPFLMSLMQASSSSLQARAAPVLLGLGAGMPFCSLRARSPSSTRFCMLGVPGEGTPLYLGCDSPPESVRCFYRRHAGAESGMETDRSVHTLFSPLQRNRNLAAAMTSRCLNLLPHRSHGQEWLCAGDRLSRAFNAVQPCRDNPRHVIHDSRRPGL